MGPRAVDHTHLRPVLHPTRWCVFISGRGSNLAALLEKPGIEVRLVVTTDPMAAGCAKARRAGVPVLEIPRQGKTIDWVALDQNLRAASIDAIFLLGFMRIVPASFIAAWSERILNLHPSLLPKYPGLKSIERAFMDREAYGATVHEVVPEVDAGPLLHARTSGHAGDSLKVSLSLAAAEFQVHTDEQRLVKEIVEIWRPQKRA